MVEIDIPRSRAGVRGGAAFECAGGVERAGEISSAAGSVVVYEKWRHEPDQTNLDEVEEYNRVD